MQLLATRELNHDDAFTLEVVSCVTLKNILDFACKAVYVVQRHCNGRWCIYSVIAFGCMFVVYNRFVPYSVQLY